ncbi:MAG TPA: 3'(2'),5'-bisphosphate nucleotidase CysQ [Cyclobacteriaceae bacterium]|nr:3'(2'),5'-bisphosphate nucleotidase CysQ [Cyclobacteriaceae bacterium]
MNNRDIEILRDIVSESGKMIMEIYADQQRFEIVDFKSDNSPLTLADRKSNEIIVDGLKKHFPSIPVLSEEGRNIPYEERRNWNRFWLVDPLDGTKEFIKRNGEFTVNIAMIEDTYPVFGIIYAPAIQVFYWGGGEFGSYKQDAGTPGKIQVSEKAKDLVAVKSRSHASEGENELYSNYPIREYISIGSSLKFCMVAEGKADLYYRHGPTMEWDTAAGQAIVEGAGGRVLNASKEKFRYNKNSLLNGSFFVLNGKLEN